MRRTYLRPSRQYLAATLALELMALARAARDGREWTEPAPTSLLRYDFAVIEGRANASSDTAD